MKLETVGVAGLGLLGSGIVTCLLSRGFRVVAYDPSETARRKTRTQIAESIEELIQRGGFPPALRQDWPERYAEAAGMSEFAGCDFVIESVFEDLNVKRALYDELEAVVAPAVPIASNTSALPISLLQSGRKHQNRFIGMHWAAPCHLTRFIEVIRGDQTDDATAEATLALGRACGKDPSLVRRDIEGFIANRLGYAMYREAFHLLEAGVADVETIDDAYRNSFGLWANIAGPFRWMDLTGLPAYAAVMQRMFPTLSNSTAVPEMMRQLVESGAKGTSTLRGFYAYTPEEAARWQRLLVEHVWTVRELSERYFPQSESAGKSGKKNEK